MKFGLTVPFRTLLNLESELVAVHREDAMVFVVNAFEQLAGNPNVAGLAARKTSSGDTKQGLMQLSQDSVPWFCTSLETVTLSEAYFQSALEALASDPKWEGLPPVFKALRISGCVEFFDNTIAIASLQGSLSDEQIESFGSPDRFELFLSELAKTIVEPLNNLLLKPVLEALSKASGRWSHGNLVRPSEAYQIFSDLNVHDFPTWSDAYTSFFWAHRIYQIEDRESLSKPLAETLRLSEIEMFGEQDNDGTIFYVGSSLVRSDDAFAAFLKASTLSQYYYCIFDVLNGNQNHLYRSISASISKKDLEKTVRNYNKMENFVDYCYNELVDTGISLQSARRRYFNTINDYFGLMDLVTAIQNRDKLVSARMKRRSFEASKTDRKILQFSLFLLGATQVITMFVDLFAYANSPDETVVPGVYELFGWLDFNITMTTLSIIIIAGALYASMRRE